MFATQAQGSSACNTVYRTAPSRAFHVRQQEAQCEGHQDPLHSHSTMLEDEPVYRNQGSEIGEPGYTLEGQRKTTIWTREEKEIPHQDVNQSHCLPGRCQAFSSRQPQAIAEGSGEDYRNGEINLFKIPFCEAAKVLMG